MSHKRHASEGRNFDRQTTIRKVHKTVLFVLQENCIGVKNGVTNGVTEVGKMGCPTLPPLYLSCELWI